MQHARLSPRETPTEERVPPARRIRDGRPPAATSTYAGVFGSWDRASWIRAKPTREGAFDGLAFSPLAVPTAHHPLVRHADEDVVRRLLAYKLLAHLRFTAVLEIAHVNPVCAALASDSAGIPDIALTEAQRLDALRIYCDEGGHALFVELLARDVKQTFETDDRFLGRPQFDVRLVRLTRAFADLGIPEPLLRTLFVTVSETLVSKVLRDLPNDPRVSGRVRAVLRDHAADEACHSVFFQWFFHALWSSRAFETLAVEREVVSRLLAELLWTFLAPDAPLEARLLRACGFSAREAATVVRETFHPQEMVESVCAGAMPSLSLFEPLGALAASRFESFALERALEESRLLERRARLRADSIGGTLAARTFGGVC